MKNLKTNYEIGNIPHPEHPTPQFQRDTWTCLNGTWKLKKLSQNNTVVFDGEILVPFSPETLNSGIANGFTLYKDESLKYLRTFNVGSEFDGKKAVLHFGAVDSECKVILNGNLVGKHIGGFTPFSFDVTDYLTCGDNSIEVIITDEATRNGGARGKQSDKRGGIWYTAQSGIWQTVWLEFMPKISIDNLKITPITKENKVNLTFDCDEVVTVTVLDEEKQILKTSGKNFVSLEYDFIKWSPDNPKLYDLILQNDSGDVVKSYFGFRSFEIVKDNNDKLRLGLNGTPYFYNGVLDQGYWSDGMLTYPSDKAVIDELTMLKEMGFNTIRKHIKIEPMRWYYHCDRLGLVVWQDFVNGGGEYKFSHVALFPFLGFHHKDDDYKYFAREDENSRNEFIQLVHETINALYNTVSVGVYVPFNEGWGQFDSKKITDLVTKLDNTRIIDSVSGWHDQGKDKTLIKSLHTYYTPLKVPKDTRAIVLSEFGGYSMKVNGHVFDESKEFGYKKFKTQDKLILALEKLYLDKLLPLIEKGLSGAIYTQVSDVEEEINGLVTYDRKVQKVPTEKMREINDKLKEVWSRIN